MILQYASDLHLEFPENKDFLSRNPIKPVGEVLLLAGDIVPFSVMDKHKDFFNYLSDNFENTYWIPGNHEYYYFDLTEKCGTIHEKIKSNVFLVNNLSVSSGKVKFIFSTLWSKIRTEHQWQIERGISDFHVIKNNGLRFSADKYNSLHEESLDFIENELYNQQSNKTVVVTHHAPTFLHYPEQHKGDVLNEAFAVELFDLIAAIGPNYWIYGHTHNNKDFTIANTHIVTNQFGYVAYGEHNNFSNSITISI